MIIIGFTFLVMIVGLCMYVLSTVNVKVQEVGSIMFAFGLLAILLGGNHIIEVGSRITP